MSSYKFGIQITVFKIILDQQVQLVERGTKSQIDLVKIGQESKKLITCHFFDFLTVLIFKTMMQILFYFGYLHQKLVKTPEAK